jgi:hypothetical protein
MMVSHIGYNVYGWELWRYNQTLQWCWDTFFNYVFGISHYKSVQVNCCWWEFRGTIGDQHWGDNYQYSYKAWAQGSFVYCPPGGCQQYVYPIVWQEVTGQGGYTSGIQ